MDRQMELAHLRLADRHIAEGELRVAAQAAMVERLRGGTYPLGLAEDLLSLLRTTLVEWHNHRALIVAALND
ncbi:MAG: hypothetical protein JO276_12915 [Sphingomonadaceae bacterium]|nr:hypothetical protein [Sphingomonadaceae bacterium]